MELPPYVIPEQPTETMATSSCRHRMAPPSKKKVYDVEEEPRFSSPPHPTKFDILITQMINNAAERLEIDMLEMTHGETEMFRQTIVKAYMKEKAKMIAKVMVETEADEGRPE